MCETKTKYGSTYVTLITSDSFYMGVQTLIYSIRKSKTNYPILVLLTNAISSRIKEKIENLKVKTLVVDSIATPASNVHVDGWVNSGYTKLNLWNLVQYEKVVYIDADAIVVDNVDELFERPEFAAAPDVFPPDKFNAGVLVVNPCAQTFQALLDKIPLLPTYDGGDTGFLNAFFSNWFEKPSAYRLPYRYNAQRTLYWLVGKTNPEYWNVIKPLKIVHFSSNPKPWENCHKKGELEMIWWEYYVESNMLSM